MIPRFALLLLPLLAVARDIRLLRLEGPENPPPRLFLIGTEAEGELDLPLLSPSTRRLAVGEEALELRLLKAKPAPREPLPADAPLIRVPAGKDDLLLILLAGPGSLGFRAEVVGVPPSAGAEGALLWFNLQPRPLHVRLGEAAATVIPPGASRATLPPVAPGTPFAARLDLGSGPEGREVRPFLRATWVRAPRGRLLSFVVADPDRAAPRILSVPDLDEAPAAPPPPRAPAAGRR